MTRSIAYFSVSFSLWLAMSGSAAGQAVMEAGLGAARSATTAAPAAGVGKSISGLTDALDKVLKSGQPASDEQPLAATKAKPAAKRSTAATRRSVVPAVAPSAPAPAPNWEDPGGVELGLGYEELVSRFGPPAMAITDSTERSLTYRGKDGMFQIRVRDGVVASIVKPHR